VQADKLEKNNQASN